MGLARLLADLILPPRCGLCGRFLARPGPGVRICSPCRQELDYGEELLCSVCGGVLSPEEAEGGGVCRDCLSIPPPFDQAAPAAVFRGDLARAIRAFKYGRRIELAGVLGWVAREMNWPASFPEKFDLIVPVPLHPSRIRSRGFNQSALIAQTMTARGWAGQGILDGEALIRTRKTRPQVELGGRDRQENVKGAFALKEPGKVEGRTILLVDDVVTTGATVRECARALKKAGAKRVFVRSVARAVGF